MATSEVHSRYIGSYIKKETHKMYNGNLLTLTHTFVKHLRPDHLGNMAIYATRVGSSYKIERPDGSFYDSKEIIVKIPNTSKPV